MKCACDVCGLDAANGKPHCQWCSLSCYPTIGGRAVEVPRPTRVLLHAAMRKPSKEEIVTAVKHAGMKTLLSILRGGRDG